MEISVFEIRSVDCKWTYQISLSELPLVRKETNDSLYGLSFLEVNPVPLTRNIFCFFSEDFHINQLFANSLTFKVMLQRCNELNIKRICYVV